MQKMINICLWIISIILLSSCFWWSDDTAEETGEKKAKAWLVSHEWKGFSLKIPAAWESLLWWSWSIPKPNKWNLELAFSSQESKENISNNLVILSLDLDKTMTSKEYAIANHTWSKWEYYSFKDKWSKDFAFQSGENSKIYNFLAKYSSSTPQIQFIQTAHICNKKKAYVMTLAIPKSVTDVGKYETMLSGFSCK